MLGNTDVTLESLAAGGVIGLRVVVGRARLRRLFGLRGPGPGAARPAPGRSPFGHDRRGWSPGWSRWPRPTARACARRPRCGDPAPRRSGRAALARRLVEGSLDRAVDVAATLELRGHSLARRGRACGESARGDDGASVPRRGRARRSPPSPPHRRGRRLRDLSADRDVEPGPLTLALSRRWSCWPLFHSCEARAGATREMERWRSRG